MTDPWPNAGGTPPGWYPDPSGQPGMRWWDGTAWADAGAQPAAAPGGYPPISAPPEASWPGPAMPGGGFGPPPPTTVTTSGKAITALVTGIFGGVCAGIPAVVAIVFGILARKEIARSGGWKKGAGMATAGIVLGAAWLVMIAVFVALGLSGAFESTNADDYAGEKREIAVLVDRVEEAFGDDDVALVCDELFTPGLAKTLASTSTSCEAAMREATSGAGQVDLKVKSITLLGGDKAQAQVDEAGDLQTWTFEKQSGTWRVAKVV